MVPDPGDPVFSAWRLAAFAHQLINEPTRLFDGNIYYPTRYTLTYSDPTVLQAVAAFPFIAAGADPLMVSNASSSRRSRCVPLRSSSPPGGSQPIRRPRASPEFWAGCPLSRSNTTAISSCSSSSSRRWRCGASCGCWRPPSWRTGACLAHVVGAQWLACMYHGVMLFVFLAPIAVFAAVAWRPPRAAPDGCCADQRSHPRGGWERDRGPVLCAARRSAAGESIDEVRFWSGTPASYGDRHRFLATYRNVGDRSQNLPSGSCFRGWCLSRWRRSVWRHRYLS